MILKKSFYQRDTITVAKDLLGKLLVREINGEEIVCRIVETEAYDGPFDKASHAYKHRRTTRTEPMFHQGGISYVYLIYGMYHCFNIVTGEEGYPAAILIRAVEPIYGLETLKKNRPIKSTKRKDLTNGPGKLCQALQINKRLNGIDITKGELLWVLKEEQESTIRIESSPRVNIDYAEEYRDKRWRFYISDNEYVSR